MTLGGTPSPGGSWGTGPVGQLPGTGAPLLGFLFVCGKPHNALDGYEAKLQAKRGELQWLGGCLFLALALMCTQMLHIRSMHICRFRQ